MQFSHFGLREDFPDHLRGTSGGLVDHLILGSEHQNFGLRSCQKKLPKAHAFDPRKLYNSWNPSMLRLAGICWICCSLLNHTVKHCRKHSQQTAQMGFIFHKPGEFLIIKSPTVPAISWNNQKWSTERWMRQIIASSFAPIMVSQQCHGYLITTLFGVGKTNVLQGSLAARFLWT